MNNPSDGWDGRHQGQLLNPGVFVYQVEYQLDGDPMQLVGTVTLLR